MTESMREHFEVPGDPPRASAAPPPPPAPPRAGWTLMTLDDREVAILRLPLPVRHIVQLMTALTGTYGDDLAILTRHDHGPDVLVIALPEEKSETRGSNQQ